MSHPSVLPVAHPQVLSREASVGMAVDGQPLGCVEQLDEECRVGSVAVHVRGAEEPFRIGCDGIPEQPTVR